MIESFFSPFSGRSTRRQFGWAAVASSALGTITVPAIVRGRNLNEKLNIAVIGVGGRGAANLSGVTSENIAALCDVYEPAVDRAAVHHPHARRWRDFRKLYGGIQPSSTPPMHPRPCRSFAAITASDGRWAETGRARF